MLSALILTNCYSSSFYSILTIPAYESTINSLEDLEKAANSDTYNMITWKDSSYLSELIYAQKDQRLYYALGQHIKRFVIVSTCCTICKMGQKYLLLQETTTNVQQ